MTPPRPDRRAARTKGASLILVVWAVGLMAAIGAIVARDAHLGARETRLIREDLSARLLAESGVRLALERLDGPETAGGRQFPHVCDLPEGRLVMDIRPVSAFIDLNAAPEELIAALFALLGAPDDLAESLAARIADYRDADSLVRPGGAEMADYMRAGMPHGPANRPFSRIGEASEVLGMPQDLLQAAIPHLTVQSFSTRVAPAYASTQVRAALDAFGAIASTGLDDDEWDLGMAGGLSLISSGAVVLRVQAATPSGRTANIAATYSTPLRGADMTRTLIEEHHAGNTFVTAAGVSLATPEPCL